MFQLFELLSGWDTKSAWTLDKVKESPGLNIEYKTKGVEERNYQMGCSIHGAGLRNGESNHLLFSGYNNTFEFKIPRAYLDDPNEIEMQIQCNSGGAFGENTDEEKKSYRKLPEKVLKLLMIKRGDHPYIGQWALPGGFVKMDESLDEAALRELKEETNIDDIYMEQLYTWGDVGRDPRTRVISTSYMSLVDSSTLDIKASDDADDAKWFTVSCKLYQEQKTVTEKGYVLQRLFNLSLSNDEDRLSAIVKLIRTVEGKVAKVEREVVESNGIAFDHAKIIEYGIERLRSKIEYTDIAFNLMPELFTLTELQQVYEVILATELLKANFRRKTADMVIETNEYTKDAGHRPSKLFRFNPNWTEA